MNRNQKTTLFSIMTSLMLIWSISLASESKTYSAQTDNGLRIELNFEKPLEVGQNEYLVQIWDANNQPVSGASVELSIDSSELTHDHPRAVPSTEDNSDMANMPGMADMPNQTTSNSSQQPPLADESVTPSTDLHNSHAEMTQTVKPSDADYTGQVNILQAGKLRVRAHVMTRAGAMTEAVFPLEVDAGNVGYSILLGFFGLNLGVVGIAAVLKRKPLQKLAKKG